MDVSRHFRSMIYAIIHLCIKKEREGERGGEKERNAQSSFFVNASIIEIFIWIFL